MSHKRFPITPEGYKRMEAELQRLKTVDRPSIITAIADARAHGDLSENAEYHAAKEKQGFIEAKISDLEARVARAHVINIEDVKSEVVQFGASVKVVDEETDEETIFKIVGEYEADISKKHISVSSPVAMALMGKRIGESIEVNTPKGIIYYEILHFEFK
jgi:transcription elongation factor GreA